MSTNAPAIEQHPDLAALRYRDHSGVTLVGQATAGLTFLTGLYLAISPWVTGFTGGSTLAANVAASNLVTGLALAVLALGYVTAPDRTRGLVFAAPLIGVWSILAPWAVSGGSPSDAMILNNVIVGAVAVLVGLGLTTTATRGLTHR